MFKGTNIAPFEDKLYLSSPTMHGDELKYIKEAYDTNWMSTVGKNIDAAERLVCEKTGRKNALGVTTGTAALHIAMRISGITRGTKVFCSDLTFVASANPIIYQGGIPIFVDSEYETWNIDPEALEKAFEQHPDVKHVVIVNLFGTPCKFDEIREVCDRHGAVIIEDAAESFGALYKGRAAGNLGDVSIISFNGNKIITGTSGGMLLADDDDLILKAKKLSTQNRDQAPWYQHSDIGYNYRMSNVIAGVIRGQIPYLDEHIAQKRAIYERYRKGFEGLPVKMNHFDGETVPNFWLSCITVNKEAMCTQHRADCDVTYKKEKGKSCPTEILNAIAQLNAEGRPLWKPMHLQPVFEKYDHICKDNSVSADLFDRGLCLPSDNKMTEEQQDKIIKVVRACFE